jgi:Arc/MetJ-type ribon-helix-helix transcriptional regulator
MGSEPAKEGATRPVALPEELVRAIEERIRGSAFGSADAFVAFVLARLLEEAGTSAFSEEDERLLKERLRSLGYID